MYKILWNGFKFGTLLQIAIGPICLFIFKTAASAGFVSAESAAAGVTFADAVYVLAAIWGVGSLIENSRSAKKYFKYFGSIVLIFFGLSIILEASGISLIPSINLIKQNSSESAFIKANAADIIKPAHYSFLGRCFFS